MNRKARCGQLLALAVSSATVLAWFPQAASATPSLTISASAASASTDTIAYTVSGNADQSSYLYVYQQSSSTACQSTVAAEQSSDPNLFNGYDVSAGNFTENGTFSAAAGSYVLCGYLTAPNQAAESNPPDAATTSQPVVLGACPPPLSFTITNIAVKTEQNGPEFDGSAQVTAQANQAGGDFEATGTDQDNEGGISDESAMTYAVSVYDNGPGAPQQGDARDYQVTLTPYDSGQCYDTSSGTVVAGGGASVTETLTVTYFSVGQGGEGSVNGAIVPGSNTETPVPGAPDPAISGASRVGASDTCSAQAPAKDYAAGYTWYVAGNKVATGKAYKIPASAYRKPLVCTARSYNNAAKPGPVGASRSVTVAVGAPVHSTGRPGLDGDTRVGGTLRVTHGEWSPKPSAYAYQWYVGSKKVPHATHAKYKIAAKYKGKKITCRVTVSAHGYADGTAAAKPVKIYAG